MPAARSVGLLAICLIALRAWNCNALEGPTTPYMVRIHSNGESYVACAGALIAPSRVLTAATCIAAYPLDSLSVVGGDNVSRKVLHVITLNGSEERSYEKDIAILELTSPMEGSGIEIVSMATVAPITGDIVEFPGWIANYENSMMTTKPKRVVRMPLISRAECERKYNPYLTDISESMLCAYESPHVDESCFSPSGSPVMYNGQLVGIMSWGETCGYGAYPALMTNIAAVRDNIVKSIAIH